MQKLHTWVFIYSVINNKGNLIIHLTYLYYFKFILILDKGMSLLSSYFILPWKGL